MGKLNVSGGEALSMEKTSYEHIALDEKETPFVAGTNLKVIELVAERLAYGWSPEELQFQHPYLTLGQIYSALAYYADHTDVLEKEIERRLKDVDRARRRSGASPLAAKLKTKRLR